MFSFFYSPLPKSDELTEVLIKEKDSNEHSQIKNISLPLDPKRKSAHYLVYDEIQACIAMLEESKKNLPAYRDLETKRNRALNLYHLLCLLTIPGTFWVMMRNHAPLVKLIEQKIAELQPVMHKAWMDWFPFEIWYNNEQAKFTQAISEGTDPAPSCIHLLSEKKYQEFMQDCWGGSFPDPQLVQRDYFGQWNARGEYHHWNIPDFCEMTHAEYYYPDYEDNCKERIDLLCGSLNNFLNCTDTLYNNLPKVREAETEFLSNYSSDYYRLQWRYKILDAQMNSLSDSKWKAWEPVSTSLFGISVTACFMLEIYLLRSWYAASKEYKEDLKQKHPLYDCLTNPEHLTRIINLVTRLNKDNEISFKELSVEELIQELKDSREAHQSKAARISFFKGVLKYKLPFEVSHQILTEAKLCPTKLRLR